MLMSRIGSQAINRKKLTNYNRLFFSYSTMIDQFLTVYDLCLYYIVEQVLDFNYELINS